MTTHEVLVKARALIECKKDWAQGDDIGLMAAPFCASTACGAEAETIELHCAAYNALGAVMGVTNVPRWNDSHTHAEVLDAFDRAIAAEAPTPDVSFLNDVDVREEALA